MHHQPMSQAPSPSRSEQLFLSATPVRFSEIEQLPPESQPAAVHRLEHDLLLRRLGTLAARDRVNEAELLVHIAEVDACRLYGATCSSMYKYCLRVLHMSEGTAYKRISAARAGRRYPAVLAAIADGRLHLSAVVLLRPHLTPASVDELVQAATHLTQKQTELMLAQRFPKPDVPTVMRALVHAIAAPGQANHSVDAENPEPSSWSAAAGSGQSQPVGSANAELSAWTVATSPGPTQPVDSTNAELSTWTVDPAISTDSAVAMGPLLMRSASEHPSRTPPDAVSAAANQLASQIAARLGANAAGPVAPQAIVQAVSQGLSQALTHALSSSDPGDQEAAMNRPKMTPLSPGRYCWQLTMPQRGQDLMDEARDLAGGDPRDNDPVAIVMAALALWVEQRRKDKFAESSRGRAQRGETGGRHVPAEIKRVVSARDGRQCTFVSANGMRCDERRDLQFDHVRPLACGGRTTVENVRLLCREHNQHVARMAFGAAHMQERTAARQRAALEHQAPARGALAADAAGTAPAAPVDQGRGAGGVSVTRGHSRAG